MTKVISYEKNFRMLVKIRIRHDKEIPEVTEEVVERFVREALAAGASDLLYDVRADISSPRDPVCPLVQSILDTPFCGEGEGVDGLAHQIHLLRQAVVMVAQELDHS